jgi:hypothetical protein
MGLTCPVGLLGKCAISVCRNKIKAKNRQSEPSLVEYSAGFPPKATGSRGPVVHPNSPSRTNNDDGIPDRHDLPTNSSADEARFAGRGLDLDFPSPEDFAQLAGQAREAGKKERTRT